MNNMLIAPEAGDFGLPRLVVPAPANPRYSHLGWPKAVRTRDGAIVLAYLSGTTHTTNGCPVVAVSRDGGKSFSEPQVMMELHDGMEFHHSGNVSLGTASDGSVVLLAMALRERRESSTIIGWRSEDSGATWSRVNTEQLENTGGSVYGHVFEAPGRGLAVTGHFREGSVLREQGLWIAFSQDHGKSWGAPQVITKRFLGEPAFCSVQGKLVGLAKGRKGSALGYVQFVSEDGGSSWDMMDSGLSVEVNPASPTIIPDPDNPHIVYAFQTERVISEDKSLPGHITLYRANAGDLQWKKVGVIAQFPQLPLRRDFGYPWMTKCEDGTWFLVFYDGIFDGSNSLWGLTLSI
ncbi:sialidase family protein [Paenibacillus sp. HB172176]|uniref:sialidase family protein n=1 Tax=Paenibacillus sp. HB172176 TaxID=2493690 RepID=UPI00143B70D1|nr:sialidase family protein [Paenibacillus sp. HB172176]